MRRTAAILTGALFVTGCADTSERIASELVKSGLDEQRAQCIGQSLERDLSLGQLRQLANVARAFRTNDSTPGRLSASDLLRVSAEVRDPAVTVAVATAAARCA